MDAIRNSGGLARTAIEAALRRQAELASKLDTIRPGGAEAAPKAFDTQLTSRLAELDATVKQADRLHLDVVQGKVQDLHEVAAQIKQTDLTFKFALATRNKLVEAYREIMRMGV